MIVATAGHVDHGKTSLVKNLTGVETDRLEEEQRRGLSITLGYAYWRPDAETVLGFIDVPGHRRFINNMISGISGIDLGMIVVAADDGPMPQTLEHLQVMRLLGVKNYVLAVTKCDRADESKIQEVCRTASALLPDETPIYEVSNTTGDGIERLQAELTQLARNWSQRAARGHFRMSIDRVFHLQGRGLVLTGTVASGIISSGENLVLQPQQKPLRIRGIHMQDAPASLASAGDRCALNVSGAIHRDDILRGDWVTSESCIDATMRFDAQIDLLPDAAFPLKHLSDVKLHIGAKHLKAKLILLQRNGATASRIKPGDSALAQLVTERPILCCHGDRFLLRDYGETALLGGGHVLDPKSPKDRKSSSTRLHFLEAMKHDDIEAAISAALDDENGILDYGALLSSWNVDAATRPGVHLPNIARIRAQHAEIWLAQTRWSGLKKSILDAILELHREYPNEPGFKPSEVASASLSTPNQGLFQPAFVALLKSDDVLIKNGLLVAKEYEEIAFSEPQEWIALSACLQKHGKQIPTLAQLEQECGIDHQALLQSIGRAQREDKLVKINAKRYALTSILRECAQAALDLTTERAELTVVNYRDHLGCGRNIAVDILEYFDGIRFTRRVGEARIILKRAIPAKFFNA
ncbi:MAG: selenocysteine-specific translation elongation factor [Woeseiaceae bacterium]